MDIQSFIHQLNGINYHFAPNISTQNISFAIFYFSKLLNCLWWNLTEILCIFLNCYTLYGVFQLLPLCVLIYIYSISFKYMQTI